MSSIAGMLKTNARGIPDSKSSVRARVRPKFARGRRRSPRDAADGNHRRWKNSTKIFSMVTAWSICLKPETTSTVVGPGRGLRSVNRTHWCRTTERADRRLVHLGRI